MRFSLTRGLWDFPSWGAPPADVGPGGAELWATFAEDPSQNRSEAERWQGLARGLGGVFCAALGSLGNTVGACTALAQRCTQRTQRMQRTQRTQRTAA